MVEPLVWCYSKRHYAAASWLYVETDQFNLTLLLVLPTEQVCYDYERGSQQSKTQGEPWQFYDAEIFDKLGIIKFSNLLKSMSAVWKDAKNIHLPKNTTAEKIDKIYVRSNCR